MDVKQINDALHAAWPNGIPTEYYPFFAGSLVALAAAPAPAAPSVAAAPIRTVHVSQKDAREMIYEYVDRNPRTTLPDIASALQITPSTAGAHLRYLAKKGRLVRSPDWISKWVTVNYPRAEKGRPSEPLAAPAPAPTTRHHASRDLLSDVYQYVKLHQGTTSAKIARGLTRWAPRTIRRALTRLVADKRLDVTTQKGSSTHFYWLTYP